MKCDSCIHNEVCKHKEEYARLKEELPVTSKPFTVDISCLGYSSKPMICNNWQQQVPYSQIGKGTGTQLY